MDRKKISQKTSSREAVLVVISAEKKGRKRRDLNWKKKRGIVMGPINKGM